jgi:hypothetical protein
VQPTCSHRELLSALSFPNPNERRFTYCGWDTLRVEHGLDDVQSFALGREFEQRRAGRREDVWVGLGREQRQCDVPVAVRDGDGEWGVALLQIHVATVRTHISVVSIHAWMYVPDPWC